MTVSRELPSNPAKHRKQLPRTPAPAPPAAPATAQSFNFGPAGKLGAQGLQAKTLALVSTQAHSALANVAKTKLPDELAKGLGTLQASMLAAHKKSQLVAKSIRAEVKESKDPNMELHPAVPHHRELEHHHQATLGAVVSQLRSFVVSTGVPLDSDTRIFDMVATKVAEKFARHNAQSGDPTRLPTSEDTFKLQKAAWRQVAKEAEAGKLVCITLADVQRVMGPVLAADVAADRAAREAKKAEKVASKTTERETPRSGEERRGDRDGDGTSPNIQDVFIG